MQIHAFALFGWTSRNSCIGLSSPDSQRRTRLHAIRINVTVIGASPTYSIRYTFKLSSTTGGPPLTISSTIPVTAQSGDFTDSVTNPLSLVGNYNVQSLSGSAYLISNEGRTENTVEVKFLPTTLNCSPPA